jgi:hypothetical protein
MEDWWFMQQELSLDFSPSVYTRLKPDYFLSLTNIAWWLDTDGKRNRIEVVPVNDIVFEYTDQDNGSPKFLQYNYMTRQIRIWPIPDTNYSIGCYAVFKPGDYPRLESSENPDPLTTIYPNVFIAAMMVECQLILENTEAVALWEVNLARRVEDQLRKAHNRMTSSNIATRLTLRTGAKATGQRRDYGIGTRR